MEDADEEDNAFLEMVKEIIDEVVALGDERISTVSRKQPSGQNLCLITENTIDQDDPFLVVLAQLMASKTVEEVHVVSDFLYDLIPTVPTHTYHLHEQEQARISDPALDFEQLLGLLLKSESCAEMDDLAKRMIVLLSVPLPVEQNLDLTPVTVKIDANDTDSEDDLDAKAIVDEVLRMEQPALPPFVVSNESIQEPLSDIKEELEAPLKEHPEWTKERAPILSTPVLPQPQILGTIKRPGKTPANVEVAGGLWTILKPHQKEGIQFLYDSVMKEYARNQRLPLGGCILAHSMGLGKTVQVVAFLQAVFSTDASDLKTCLVVCPASTVTNWEQECARWLSLAHRKSRPKVWVIKGKSSLSERIGTLEEWNGEGGIMLLSYNMYISIFQCRNNRDYSSLVVPLNRLLRNPGPDLLVCDEAHYLKNPKGQKSRAISKIRTGGRICLTGTPIQNNLWEYYHLFSFVMPGLLGDKCDFDDQYVTPILRGTKPKATLTESEEMRDCCKLLRQEVADYISIVDVGDIDEPLPQKCEHVIRVRMSKLQVLLYETLIARLQKEASERPGDAALMGLKKMKMDVETLFERGSTLIAPKAAQLITFHPRCLHLRKRFDDYVENLGANRDDEKDSSYSDRGSDVEDRASVASHTPCDIAPLPQLDYMTSDEEADFMSKLRGSPLGSLAGNKKKAFDFINSEAADDSSSMGIDGASDDEGIPTARDKGSVRRSKRKRAQRSTYLDLDDDGREWYEDILPDCPDLKDGMGAKAAIVRQIVIETIKRGEKLLIFSDRLVILEALSELLQKIDEEQVQLPNEAKLQLVEGTNFLRLDGRFSAEDRHHLIRNFNDSEEQHVLLLSIAATGVGINLVGASRVILLEPMWNPAVDEQALFRAYRFGQTKPVHVYRLVTSGIYEEDLFNVQLHKHAMNQRIMHQKHGRKFKANVGKDFLLYKEPPPRQVKCILPEDPIVQHVFHTCVDQVLGVDNYDILLENRRNMEDEVTIKDEDDADVPKAGCSAESFHFPDDVKVEVKDEVKEEPNKDDSPVNTTRKQRKNLIRNMEEEVTIKDKDDTDVPKAGCSEESYYFPEDMKVEVKEEPSQDDSAVNVARKQHKKLIPVVAVKDEDLDEYVSSFPEGFFA